MDENDHPYEEMVLNNLWQEVERIVVEIISEAANCFYFGGCHEVLGGTDIGSEFRD